MPEEKKHRVAVVYHFAAHYRAAVFRALLNSERHEYTIVADEQPVDDGIPVFRVDDPERFVLAPCKRLFGSLIVQRGLLSLAFSRKWDCIIYLGNPHFASTWVSAALARILQKRVLFWTHGWTRREVGAMAFVRATFYRLAHGLLLYGHNAKAVGIEKGFAAERLYVIYNSLDYLSQVTAREAITESDIVAVRRELFGDEQVPIVICSARLTSKCGFGLLLEAQDLLRDCGHAVNIILVGDGPDRARLEAEVARRKLPVRFLGACYEERRLALLTMAANVTVSPGKIGLTAMQSLAYGTPVITHDDWQNQMPEFEAIIPGRTGELFRRGSATDLARVVKEWTQCPTVAEQVRLDCRKLIERFYNPAFQRLAIERAVSGFEADDLFWMREHEERA